MLSEQLRLLTPHADIPTGCVVGSYSWREMMALAAYRAGKNWLRAAKFGFWRNPKSHSYGNFGLGVEFVPGDRSGIYTCVIPNKRRRDHGWVALAGRLRWRWHTVLL